MRRHRHRRRQLRRLQPACPTGQRCVMGGCVCPAGQTRCGDACVDPQTSDAHCGMCNNACPAGQRCAMGACVCPEGQTRCGAACVDTRSDRANCGACGNACPAGQVCDAGACRIDCTAPEVGCTAGGAMVCVDTRANASHCGGCNMVCVTPAGASGAACRSGACAAVCAAGRGDCDGAFANGCEVDTATSNAHCGRCGNACPATVPDATAVGCAAGACAATCRAGRGDCDGALANGCETDVTATPAHCGRCGNACATGEACVAGRCLPRSCASARAGDPAAASGVYRIDPDGPGGVADFEVYCDMATAGGGWTLLATVYNTLPADTRRWNTDAVFQDDTAFGDLAMRAADDFKSPAYARLAGRDLLVLTEEYHFGFNGLLGDVSLAAYIRARVSPMCSTAWIRSGADFASTNVPMNVQRTLGFTIRGLDVNGGGPTAGCAVAGSNENSFLDFLSGPSWWVFGVGNCVGCAGGWTSYDNGMLNLASIMTGSCTANSWPCNANGLWWQSGIYPSNPDTKTRYVQLLVR
ncbi:MAG: fibrinogen-like YCDxxxxGGGW domain-containing protein [Polyangiales bacterium]